MTTPADPPDPDVHRLELALVTAQITDLDFVAIELARALVLLRDRRETLLRQIASAS